MKKILFIILISVLSLSINSCAKNVSSNTYQTADVGVASRVVSGVVVAKRQVNIDNNSGVGGIAGAAAGGVAGSTVGGSLAGHALGAVGGAVIGGVAGNMIDKGINHHTGYEYIIKLKNGSTISVAQMQDQELSVHQHVLVIYGAMTRVVPDTTA